MQDMFVLNSFNKPVATGLHPYRGAKGRGLVATIGLPFLLMFPLFGAFLLAMVVPSTLRTWSEEQRLRVAGQPITGVVTDLAEDSDSNESSYYVTYSYEAPLANSKTLPLQHKEPVAQELYQRLERGAMIELRYLPDQPGVVRLANNINSSAVNVVLLGVFLLVWIVGFCGLPLYLALRLIKAWRKERHLAQDGRLIMGEVIAFSGNLDSDDDYSVELRYRFHSPQGSIIEDKASGIYNQLKGSALPTGTPVAIWYLDQHSYTLL
ncbi:MAG: DUF3592 domain-containing protein [Roseiflexaceae bacterium]|nr:DUF3592 domain-containing protein [Roseiflexaceae bacterium]